MAAEKKKTLEELADDLRPLVEKRRLELAEELKRKVHAFIYKVPGTESELAVLYLQDPVFQVRKKAIDQSYISPMDAKATILDCCVIKNDSDERIWGEDAEDLYPELRIGALESCSSILARMTDLFKKK